jgi:Glycosyltransferase family 87
VAAAGYRRRVPLVLRIDLALYLLSAGFAGLTAATSTLAPHRAWGAVAVGGYLAAAIATALLRGHARRPQWRSSIAAGAWVLTCLLPLVLQAIQRASGRSDRAQEEVQVIEHAGRRLLEHGTPYLGRAELASLDHPLLGYLPYQPGMALFGLPRSLDPLGAWWSDARVWFALATAAMLIAMHRTFRDSAGVRALQAVTVLPVASLTLATGGDDLPVLLLCLLGLWLFARGRPGWSGVAVGAACALKLFAWPVAVVLAVVALRRRAYGFLGWTLGLPIVSVVPVLLRDPRAMLENVVAFPFGHGLVSSPAASPLPGHLIALQAPAVATALLVLAMVAVLGYLALRPPRATSEAALVAGLALLTAMLLLPSSRFGYLLYPAALLLWVPALRSVEIYQSPAPTPTDVRVPRPSPPDRTPKLAALVDREDTR